jgi:cobalt-zinc-cadmium efflux system membrane fusion protein
MSPAERRIASSGIRGRVPLVTAIVVVVMAAAGGFLLGTRHAAKTAGPSSAAIPPQPPSASPPQKSEAEPVEVTLTPEAVARAGIKSVVVGTGATTATISVPGTVTSNAYRETKSTALVGGIVRSVTADLGARVTRGQPLAVITSTDLADAQMKYLSGVAMLTADHQKLVRTEKLVQIGAASRQELDDITAIHAAHESEVAAARQRLLLLGLSPQRVDALRDARDVVSEVTVAAPNTGTVIARTVNPGQVVNAAQDLFVVADLATLWVIGDLYEKDFAAVREGSGATVTVPPEGRVVRGRVAYIDPRVDPGTRTAKVRIEVPNTDGTLRLGMFVNVAFSAPSARSMTVVPRSAVQSIGERTVVYVVPEAGEPRFVERPVKISEQSGDLATVLDGLKPGERVVTEGSFFLRAEAARTRTGG